MLQLGKSVQLFGRVQISFVLPLLEVDVQAVCVICKF